jgi:hypothetical protein
MICISKELWFKLIQLNGTRAVYISSKKIEVHYCCLMLDNLMNKDKKANE